MLDNWQNRTILLLGKENVEALQCKHVLIVGLGGVGAYAAEMLVRAGVGEITIVDADKVDVTNRNRQLVALISTYNQPKVEVLKNRFLDINPRLKIHAICDFLAEKNTVKLFDNHNFDYLIDAIDTISPKVFLMAEALKRNIPIVSAMGSGGKLDPSKIHLADISKSYQCPLAANVRKRLRKIGIYKGIKVIFSSEESRGTIVEENTTYKRTSMGTISYMPAIFGCWCASVCLQDLTIVNNEKNILNTDK